MTPEETIILVVGDRAWGKGATLDEARDKMVQCGGKRCHYVAYVAHPDTRVDEMGDLCFPTDQRPKLIHRAGRYRKE